MVNNEIKELLLNYIRNCGHATFAEIDYFLEDNNIDYKGDYLICSDKNHTIKFWGEWSSEMIEILNQLLSDKEIRLEPCDASMYQLCGKVPALKLAKSPTRQYKKDRWVPVIILPRKAKSKKKTEEK